MNNITEEWLAELGDITDMQECLLDVFENCMCKSKYPFYSISLLEQIKVKSENLYSKIDEFLLKYNND